MTIKSILAGTTALAILGGTVAYAQQPPRGPKHERWKPTAEDVTAFTDARVAGLKAGLKLTPDQEKNWPAVETALRDLAKQRADRVAARQAGDKDRKADDQVKRDPIQRLAERADRMSQTGASLKKLADAAAPLYQSLDEGQKRRFMMLARIGMRDFGGMERDRRGPRERGHHRWRHRGGPDAGADRTGPQGAPR